MTAVAFVAPGSRLLASSGVDVFWLFCLVIVLFQVWRGWRTGLFRQLAVVVGLLAGWVIGLTQGPAFFAHFWAGTKLPSSVLVFFASAFLGLMVYAIAILAGHLLFKRACDHPIGPTRLFLGAGGAFVGLFVGLIGVWMVIVVARLAGSIAQVQVDNSVPEPSRWTPRNAASEASAPALVRIQRSVQSGLIGDVVRWTDPFPKEAYTDLNKVARIAADPQLQERLWSAPDLKNIATDPKMIALRQDPAVTDALQSGNYLSLFYNRHFLAVVHDPRLSQRLERVDITRVLNETVP